MNGIEFTKIRIKDYVENKDKILLDTDYKVSIMGAYINGNMIELCHKSERYPTWVLCDFFSNCPSWDWDNFNYRVYVKPEPKYRVIGINELPPIFYIRFKNDYKNWHLVNEIAVAPDGKTARLYIHNSIGLGNTKASIFLSDYSIEELKNWEWTVNRKEAHPFVVEDK